MDDVDRDMNIVGPRTRWMDDVDRDMNIVGPRTRWMDDVDRDMNIVGLENNMDGQMWTETSVQFCR